VIVKGQEGSGSGLSAGAVTGPGSSPTSTWLPISNSPRLPVSTMFPSFRALRKQRLARTSCALRWLSPRPPARNDDRRDANVRIGDEVVVLGNSGGGGVVTSLKGEVRGLGPDRIEVSAEFIRGTAAVRSFT